MSRKTKSFISKQDKTKITYYEWTTKKPKGIFQIVHGSIEYALRYEKLAKALNKAGYSVYAMDIRGHGETGKRGTMGFIAPENGAELVMSDVHQMFDIIKKENKTNKKTILLGHSMGSFIVRAYATQYKDFDGLIAIGTNHRPKVLINLLSTIASIKSRKQADQPADLLNKMSYKAFDKPFKGEGDLAWLSLSEKNRKNYAASPLTSFEMTNKAMYDFSVWLKLMTSKKEVSKMDKKVPVLLLNGSRDIVGLMGKDVIRAKNFYTKLGYDTTHCQYENMRHEILNEDISGDVEKDIIKFANKI